MPITPDRMTRLREFGLSEYAARAYLALLDLGVAEARDVSTLSKVPQAKIYHVLEQLHEKGLAVILPEFPKKYAPVPFPEYLDRIHSEHERAADAIMRDREILADMFRVMGDTEVGNRGFFTVIRGRRNVMSKLAEMLNDAKKDFFVVGTTGLSSRHTGLMPELEKARDRGVTLRGLIPLTAETMSRTGRLSEMMELRARDIEEGDQSSRVAIVVVDGQRAFLINFLPDDDNIYTGKDVGVYTDQEAMVAALATLVEPHWAKATPFASRREELATGRMADVTTLCTTREAAITAFEGGLARGVREIRVIDSQPASAPTPAGLAVADRLRSIGGTYRAALNVTDLDTARALSGVLEASPGSELRHLSQSAPARFWLLDDREAFISLLTEGHTNEVGLLVHTTNANVVRSLRSQFEEAWSRALPLGKRLQELEVFPHLQPRDLGMGRLFDDVRDAIFVVDASGRILLWNAGATAAFGYDVAEALGLRVGELLPDVAAALRDASGGATLPPFETHANHKNGDPISIELSLHPARDAKAGVAYVIAIARRQNAAVAPGAPRTRLDVHQDAPVTKSASPRRP